VKPLAIDLFCGLGGWTEGLLAEGWNVVGFDIERHVYGDDKYPAQLVIQDVHTIHGSQFKDAQLIVASPPCQEFSYMAMPWSKAKEKQRRIEADPAEQIRLTALFDACFRIQREAEAAAGRHIPLVVENVRGAQKWVGRAKWNFGSFYLWGDVPALMPMAKAKAKVGGINFSDYGKPGYKAVSFNGEADRRLREGIKNSGGSWFAIGSPEQKEVGRNPVHESVKASASTAAGVCVEGVKGFTPDGTKANGKHGHPRILAQIINTTGSGSKARKRASAEIAKIPMVLSRHIAKVYNPQQRLAQ
jgi:hypothetical protein